MNAVLLCVFLVAARGDADLSSRVTEAQAFAQKGDFAAAAELYRRAARQRPDSVDLLYNAGTAALKAGDIGQAVLQLERALRLEPGDADVIFNLERAREHVGGPLGKAARLPWPGQRLLDLSARRWQQLVWVVLLVALLVAVLRLATGRGSVARRVLLLTCLLLALAGLGLSAATYQRQRLLQSHHAVLVGRGEAVVRELPDSAAPSIFTIESGQRLLVVERRPAHVRVELLNGLQGWLPAERVVEIQASSS